MHMIDTLICIVYIFVGAKWVLKKVEIETISAPTNWKIIVLKFLIWLVVPLEIFIYIHFYDSGMVRIFLGASVMLLYLIETRLLFNEMSKAIVESNIDNREKDVKHIQQLHAPRLKADAALRALRHRCTAQTYIMQRLLEQPALAKRTRFASGNAGF